MKQNELVRILRKELAIKEKELADQKWVFEQFLKSPSWRLTYPLRWLANLFRAPQPPRPLVQPKLTDELISEKLPGVELETAPDLKSAFATQYRQWLESFLASGSHLQLPHSTTPEISVLLVLFNRAELTFACLRSIAECITEKIEVIIVDNASSDDTPALLDRLRGVRIIRNTENLNFLLAVNQAAKEAQGTDILLLNNDAQLQPGALTNALHTLKSSPDIGAVGGKIVLLDGSLQEAGSIVWQDGSCLGYGRGDNPQAPSYMFRRDVDYCSGAFLLTPRRIWNELGGFDESFKPAYYEETDYCMRLWERGLRVVYEPSTVLVHYEFASSESSASAIQLQVEHRQILADRHRATLGRQYLPNSANVLLARSKGAGERVLFFDERVPHVWLGSGLPRARTILQSLLKLGCLVTLYPLAEVNEAWDMVYTDLPREIEVMTGFGVPMLEMFLRNRQGYYTTIIVSRPHNMRVLRPMLLAHPDWFENVHVIYDAEALFSERDALMLELGGTSSSKQEMQKALDEEIGLAAVADSVLSVSENERASFSRCGIPNVRVLGHTMEASPTPTPFDLRSGLLFVGAIHSDTSPNADSIIWFLTEVFPKIQRQLGDTITLTIAGVNHSERIRKLAGPNAHITGRLADLRELYANARLFIAPTRFAAGIPHKVHESAAQGLPVVATPLLANQLGWTDRELAIAGDAETFAMRCVELYMDAGKWSVQRNAALERVRIDCSSDAFDTTVKHLLTSKPRA